MLHSTDSHSGQGKGLRVGKGTHQESSTHRTTTPTTYLCYITPGRCLPPPPPVLCSAPNGISPEISRAAPVTPPTLCLPGGVDQVRWAHQVKRPSVCTLRFHSAGLFPKRDIWGQSVAKGFVLKVEHLLWPKHSLANPLKGRNLKTLLASSGHRKFGFKDQTHKVLLCISLGRD